MTNLSSIRLTPVPAHQAEALYPILQRAFYSTSASSPQAEGQIFIPPWERVKAAAARADGVLYQVSKGAEPVGGVLLFIDPQRGRNHLDLFFLDPGIQGQGVGSYVWRQVEALYPETVVWTAQTPAFASRNLAFYTCRCGFVVTGQEEQAYGGNPNRPRVMCNLEKRMGGR